MSVMDETDQYTEAAERPLLRRTFAAHLEAGDGRTVDVRIVPYGERITHNDGLGGVPRGEAYVEEWMPGAFDHQLNAAHRVVANYEHQAGIGGIVGKGQALRSSIDGFYGSFRILDGSDGDKTLQLIRDNVLDGVSLEARPVKTVRSKDGVMQRVKANLYAVAFTRFAAFSGARVLAVREEAADVVIDEALLPFEMDSELVERCRQLGVALPQRYEAQPDVADTPAEAGTSEDGTRQPNDNNTFTEVV